MIKIWKSQIQRIVFNIIEPKNNKLIFTIVPNRKRGPERISFKIRYNIV